MTIDRWREILEVMWRRRLRSVLTALSVAWGIFMLVLLLAAGQGLQNGAKAEFSRNAHNSLYLHARRTSKPHRGMPVGKPIQLRNQDRQLLERVLPGVTFSSARADIGTVVIRRGPQSGGFTVKGCLPDNAIIERSVVTAGRFINPTDQTERRKVAVIGSRVRAALFGENADPLGEELVLGNVVFKVVGVFDEAEEQSEQETVYIPLSTAQLVWARADRVERVMVTLGPAAGQSSGAAADADAIRPEVQRVLARRHGFAADDERALYIWSSDEMWKRFARLFAGIRTFVWLIGLGTILAGVVGVSNIMLISVQERTREIGVRKAVGATPRAIVTMIVEEALFITLTSGYLGLVAGVVVVSAVGSVLPPTPYFRQPEVNFGAALAATLVLTLAGVAAGLFPGLRAARINPIAALRVE